MSVHDLIEGMDFSSNQRNEMFIAYDENQQGFERIAKRAAGANNPPAALISMVRKGDHQKAPQLGLVRGSKPTADTLEDVVSIALRAFNARQAKYPGWDADAIGYGVWIATTWNTRVDPEAIERGLRARLGTAWTTDEDPDHRVIPERHLAVMPEPEITTQTLAERLLATLGG